MIILDDFEYNNIQNIESFANSNIYNRIVLSESQSGGMYLFYCNFGGQSTFTFDVHTGTSRIQSGAISASARSLVNYINNSSSLRDLGIRSTIINNYSFDGAVLNDIVLLTLNDEYNDIMFVASPYYLLISPFDYSIDVDNNLVRFVAQTFDTNVLYADILNDEASELIYGTQILAPNLQFVGTDFYTYRNLVNNYLEFFKDLKQIITLVVDYEMQNTIPLDLIEVRFNLTNINKYMFMSNWQEKDTYVYKRFFLVGAGKIDHGLYKVKLKEI